MAILWCDTFSVPLPSPFVSIFILMHFSHIKERYISSKPKITTEPLRSHKEEYCLHQQK